MRDSLTLLVEGILNRISNRLRYKGFALEESLIAHRYLIKVGFKGSVLWKRILKLIIGTVKTIVFRKRPYIISKIKSENTKIIVAINFPILDIRHSKILMDFIEYYPQRNDLVVFTNQKCVFDFCSDQGLSYVYIKIPTYNFLLKDLFNGYSINECIILNEYRLYIDFLDVSYKKLRPKLVMTTQDFLLPDFYYAKVAKASNIKTITHQHGYIPDSDKTLFSFLTSDFCYCWGELSKQKLARSLPGNKLKIVGTTKFNDCKFVDDGYIKDSILITPTVMQIESLKKILGRILSELSNYKNVVIKIHPSQNMNEVSRIVSELKFNRNVVVTKDNLSVLLRKAAILINIRSGIFLEALISKTSIIELNLDGSLFCDVAAVENSHLTYKELKKEVERRMNDKVYAERILLKQLVVFQKDVFSTNMDVEYELIRELIK